MSVQGSTEEGHLNLNPCYREPTVGSTDESGPSTPSSIDESESRVRKTNRQTMETRKPTSRPMSVAEKTFPSLLNNEIRLSPSNESLVTALGLFEERHLDLCSSHHVPGLSTPLAGPAEERCCASYHLPTMGLDENSLLIPGLIVKWDSNLMATLAYVAPALPTNRPNLTTPGSNSESAPYSSCLPRLTRPPSRPHPAHRRALHVLFVLIQELRV